MKHVWPLCILFVGLLHSQPVRVTLGEPNLVSLDQAHYLLSQMAARNGAMRPKEPGLEDLDPSAVTGSRLKALRQSVNVGGEFDARIGLSNEYAAGRIGEDASRRVSLTRQLDSALLRVQEKAALASSLAAQHQILTNSGTATKEQLEAAKISIERASAEQAAAQKEADAVTAALAGDSVPKTLTSPNAPVAANTLPAGVLEKVIDKLAAADPKTHVSAVLDNYIGFQHEMILKQVTLLRDEAGYNRKIVFVELPYSFFVQGGKKADGHLAQIQWELYGFTRTHVGGREPTPSAQADNNTGPLLRRDLIRCAALAQQNPGISTPCQVALGGSEASREMSFQFMRTSDSEVTRATAPDRNVTAAYQADILKFPANTVAQDYVAPGTLRTVELVPRISALNVNDRNYASTGWAFAFAAKLIGGFGASASYQRQKELFEQFIHQEAFATAYGKGERRFGWTFGPVPGNTRLSPGLRTTYAIFSIPANADLVTLRGRTCVYKQNELPPDPNIVPGKGTKAVCDSAMQEFILTVPNENQNGFWATGVRYQPVAAGARQTVHLEGTYFSTLTGVLINGVPLRRAVAVANPELTPIPRGDGGRFPDGPMQGEFEMLNDRKLLLSFAMPAAYEGTPEITLITPIKARRLNDLRTLDISVGGTTHAKTETLASLADKGRAMFFMPPQIESVRLFRGIDCKGAAPGFAVLHIGGRGFSDLAYLRIGGRPVTGTPCTLPKSDLLTVALNGPDLVLFERPGSMQFTIIKDDGPLTRSYTAELPNPAPVAPVITGYEVVQVTAVGKGTAQQNRALIRLKGMNFPAVGLAASVCAPSVPTCQPVTPVRVSGSQLLVDIPKIDRYAVVKVSVPAATLATEIVFAEEQKKSDDGLKVQKVVTTRTP